MPLHQLVQIVLCNFTLAACLFTDKRIYQADTGSPASGAEETVADCVCSFNRRHISAIESARKWVAAAPGLLFGVVYDGVITVAKKSAKERLLVVIVNRKDFPGSRQLHNLGGGDVITLA